MAIPFNWPTEEDTEEYYRRLDQLLADLYDVLRHILLRPRVQVNHPQLAAVARGGNQEPPDQQGGEPPEPPGGGDGGGDNEGAGGIVGENSLEQRLRPLPDLVASTEPTDNSTCSSAQHPRPSRSPSSNSHRHPSRRHRARRSSSPRKKSCCALKVSHSLKTSSENWIFVGQELRKIAEEFRASYLKEEITKSKLVEEDRQVEVKASSLFSLLVPAPFSSSIWTTVIILVGWRLLMRNR